MSLLDKHENSKFLKIEYFKIIILQGDLTMFSFKNCLLIQSLIACDI